MEPGLNIIELLQNMKKSILSGSVELRDPKKKKTLEVIDEITFEKLSRIVSEYDSLADKKEEIAKRIGENPTKSRIKELEYKLEHIVFKIKKINDI